MLLMQLYKGEERPWKWNKPLETKGKPELYFVAKFEEAVFAATFWIKAMNGERPKSLEIYSGEKRMWQLLK